MKTSPSAWISLAAVSACALIGGLNGPQQPRAAAWYLRLRKPALTPPGPVIGATWGVLEIILTAIGYRLLGAKPSRRRSVALGGWSGTLLGLAGFPWLFFRKRDLRASTIAAGAMMASAAATALAARRIDPATTRLSTPLLAWLAFATLLSEALLRKNPGR
jgi:tryptophan-rich sensory protein